MATYQRVMPAKVADLRQQPPSQPQQLPKSLSKEDVAVDVCQEQGDNEVLLPRRIRENLYALIGDFPEGLSLYNLSKEYKKKFGHEFDFGNYGCGSMHEFCLSMCSNLFKTAKRQPESRGSEYFAFPHFSNLENDPKFCGNGKVPKDVLEKILHVVQSNKGRDIPFDLFSKEYAIHNGKALNCIKYDFKNLEELLSSVEFLKLERRMGKHGGYRTFVCLKESSTDLLKADLFNRHQGNSNSSFCQTEFVQAEDFIRQEPFVYKKGDDFDAFLGEVRNIDDFWIMLDRHAVTKLMDELEEFYDDEDRSLASKMSTTSVLEGMYCVAPYDKMWHRAKITKILCVEEVQVFYIDYGTRGKVKQDDLRFLHCRFATLPAQAVLCQLYGIRPLRRERPDKYSPAARDRFWKLVKPALNDGIFARVMGVQRLQNSPPPQQVTVFLQLVDTASNDDPKGIDVAATLVKEGLVEVDPKSKDSADFKVSTRVLNVLECSSEVTPLRVPVDSSPSPTKVVASVTPSRAVASVIPQTKQPSTSEVAHEMLNSSVQSSGQTPQPTSIPYKPDEVPSFFLPKPPSHQQQQQQPPPRQQLPPTSPPLRKLTSQPGQVNQNLSSADGASSHASPFQGQQPSGQIDARLNAAAQPFNPIATNHEENPVAPPKNRTASPIADTGRNLLKKVTLDSTGSDCPAPVVLHIINLSGKAYLISAEVSQLFPRWKKRDLLQQMLDLKKKKMDTVIVAKGAHDELFEQAICENVLGFLDKERNVMDTVRLYKLEDLRRIVAIFQGDEALDAAVDGLCRSFDPESPHWQEKFY